MSMIYCPYCGQLKDSDFIEFHIIEFSDNTTDDQCNDCYEKDTDVPRDDYEKYIAGAIHAARHLEG